MKALLITHNGLTKSIRGWAEELNICREYIRKNIKSGLSMDSIIKKYKPLKRTIIYNGKEYSLTELAMVLNMKKSTLRERIERGWSLERATTEDVAKKNKKGTGSITGNGYKRYKIKGSEFLEHRLIVEKVLGRKLPSKHPVHHVDGIKLDNSNGNLVVCEDTKYHMLLHKRTNAYIETGNPNYLKCGFCKKHDHPKNLSFVQNRHYHSECFNKYQREYRVNKRTTKVS